MARKITIELNHEGIQELLMSDAIAAECEKAAQAIASRAGEGFEVTKQQTVSGSRYGGTRVGYGVRAATYAARRAEAENKTLSKAVR